VRAAGASIDYAGDNLAESKASTIPATDSAWPAFNRMFMRLSPMW
jgi:hypothetical protein